MVESAGKKLHDARLKRGLTIEEAAHATKLRPDKIAALESDDYSRFANNTYARGFLQIYARFLKVDVDDFARTLDNANPISVSDYQYLSNAPTPRRETHTVHVDERERHRPSFAPLFFFILLVAGSAGGWWVWKTAERIQIAEDARTGNAPARVATPTPNPDADFIADTPPRPAITPRGPFTPSPSAAPTPSPRTAAATPSPGASPAPLVGGITPPPGGPDQDFVKPAPISTGNLAARSVPPGGVNEVLVATVRKTWVTVRKDDPKAQPIFDDYVYPNANPLKLKGARFFIEARDPASVQITKNGLPFAYQPGGAPVQ
jgi:cytoskeletal protein RodZ